MTVPQSPGPMSRCLQVCPTALENAETQSKNWFTPDKARGQCLQVCAPVPYGALGWAACELVEKRFRPAASAATKVSPLVSCFTEKKLAVKTSLALWFFAQEPHRCVGGEEKNIYIHLYNKCYKGNKDFRLERFLSHQAQPSYKIQRGNAIS